MNFFLEKEIEHVRVIDKKRDYWFIRSYSGILFDTFKREGYIAIGLNSVPYEYIKTAAFKDQPTVNRLKIFIENNLNYKGGEATKWANQLINFEHNVKEGDIVIVPTEGSRKLAIGVITSKTYISDEEGTFKFRDKYEAFPQKRKKVDWLKIISKSETLGELSNLFSSHQAVTKANEFSDIIEGIISAIFIKDEQVHLVLEVNQDEDINAYAFRDFLDGLTYFYEEFSKDAGDEVGEDLSIKIKVQSRGKVALIGLSTGGLLGLAALVALSDNSEFEVNLKNTGSIKAKTTGFLQSWSNKKDADLERKMRYEAFKDSLERLEVKPVDTAVNIEDVNDEDTADPTLLE